ncbi:MAG: PDZ domain-containing protein [Ruminococcaceae bacterium]|nr:PDZ domain-containing protein [Oscillospiraceae bacterium]
MKKSLKRILALVCGVLLLASPAAALELSGAQEYLFIHDLVDFVYENAKFPEEKEKLLDVAFHERLVNPESGFNGMVEAVMDCLDEHSGYMDETTYRSYMQESVSGEFAGIGVNISIQDDAFVVISAIAGSPAEKAGIISGDILVAVDDENIEEEEFEAVRARITGQVGTTVKITVRRGSELLSFTVMRDMIASETVYYEIMDGIGYLQLTGFTQTSVEGVKEAINYFETNGVKDLIMDLRNNPGGEMNAALDICRLFTPSGVIMRVEYANSKNNVLFYNEEDSNGKFNLAVLVNGGSASASELFTGAIQDTSSGTIIGNRTFGKGTVQTIMPIVSGGGIRLTVAEYKTAGGRAVHHKGITPDIVVENTTKIADTSYMVPMVLGTEWKAGDTGEGVLALEQRLAFWGYMEEADEVADEETATALRLFQVQNGLTVTGTADVYTQIRLNDVNYAIEIESDDQLAAAMEFLKNEG